MIQIPQNKPNGNAKQTLLKVVSTKNNKFLRISKY